MQNAYSGADQSLGRIWNVLLDFAAIVGRKLYKMPNSLHSHSWTVSATGTCIYGSSLEEEGEAQGKVCYW